MSKRKAPANTYWRKDVLWGRVRLTGQPAHQWSLGTNDPKIAARRVAEYKTELTGRVKFGEARRSFEEAAAEWGLGLTDRVSSGTATRYLCSLSQLTPHLEAKFLDQIDGTLIADIIKARRHGGASVSTIKRDLVALSSVMGFAIDEGWLESNPVLPRLGRLKERRDPISLPEAKDIAVVIQQAGRTLKGLVQAAWQTGCRQTELALAKRSHFSPVRRQLTVVGKRNKMRTIDLSDEAFETLSAAAGLTNGEWLFPSEDGDYHRSIATSFYRLVRNLGDRITPFRFHDLRHRFAVDYLQNHVGSIYELQQHLGHTSVKTTEIYLAYLSGNDKQAAMFGK